MYKLTRQQLSQFLPSQEAIKIFEHILKDVGENLPDDIENLQLSTGNTQADVYSILAQLSEIHNILQYIALEPRLELEQLLKKEDEYNPPNIIDSQKIDDIYIPTEVVKQDDIYNPPTDFDSSLYYSKNDINTFNDGIMLTSVDLNTIFDGGKYGIIGSGNTNTAQAGEHWLEVLNDGTRAMQVAFFLDGKVYMRYYASSTWSAWTASSGGGVTDHGALTGLADDDHTQYHNDTRGDARYLKLSGGTLSSGGTEYALTWNKTGSKNWTLGSYAGGAYITNATDTKKHLQFLDTGETLLFSGGTERARFNTTGDLNLKTYLNLSTSTTPATPLSGVNLHFKQFARNELIISQALSNKIRSVQTNLSENFGLFQPYANSTAVNLIGLTYNSSGTAVVAPISTTNYLTYRSRISYQSASTASSSASWRVTNRLVTVGNNSKQSGFYYAFEFGIPTVVAGTRGFFGLQTSTSANTFTASEPSALLSCVGVGFDSTDSTLQIMHNDASVTATKINTTWTLTNGHTYKLILYSPANSTSTVYYYLERLNDNTVLSGTLTTKIPTPVELYGRFEVGNGSVASRVYVDVCKLYMELDS